MFTPTLMKYSNPHTQLIKWKTLRLISSPNKTPLKKTKQTSPQKKIFYKDAFRLLLTNKSSLKLVGEELLDCAADCFESFGNRALIQTLQIQCTEHVRQFRNRKISSKSFC